MRLLAILTFTFAGHTIAIEEAEYKTVLKDGDFELRDYKSQFVAETRVSGSQDQAGNTAFRRLFRYISGNNTMTNKIAMTAPVGQVEASEKIAMTAPVSQSRSEESWIVSFMMPAKYTMKTLPAPNDSNVTLREIPARRVAAVRYSGRWTEELYNCHLSELRAWMKTRKLAPDGAPEWARYNAPFTLPILRRNEVLIPVAPDSGTEQTD